MTQSDQNEEASTEQSQSSIWREMFDHMAKISREAHEDSAKREDEPTRSDEQQQCPVCNDMDPYPTKANSLERTMEFSFVFQAAKKQQCSYCIFLCDLVDAYSTLLAPEKGSDYRITDGMSMPKHRRYGWNQTIDGPSITLGTTPELIHVAFNQQSFSIYRPADGSRRNSILSPSASTDETAKFPCRWPYEPRSDSIDTFDYIQANIERCRKYHNKCMEALHVQNPPKRLILVPGEGTKGARLVIESEIQDIRYAALSHCWGRAGILRTLKSNINEMQENIDWDSMPQTFRDAIIVCQRLQIKFIWIDALCIIQDDLEDWAVESTKMGSYYGGAYITIGASSSSGAQEAFLGQRPDIPETKTIILGPQWENPQHLLVAPYKPFDPVDCYGPLSQRG